MRSRHTRTLVAFPAVVLAGCGVSETELPPPPAGSATTAPATPPTATPPPAPRGASTSLPASSPETVALYQKHCGMCHGPTGRGDGPLAKALNPKPRGFVDEPWRFIQASDPDAVREAIEVVIRDGLPKSGMPGFGSQLNDVEITAIAEHVLVLRVGEEQRP